MSYFIRTPHTIFEVVGENDRVYFVKAKGNPNNTYSKSKCQAQVLAAADTIEELCDGYIIEHPINAFKFFYDKEEMLKCLFNTCFHLFDIYELKVYAVIKTDKGLIYVAKMNEDGVLCLI